MCLLKIPSVQEERKCTFVQKMECAPSMYELDRPLVCSHRRGSTADEVNHFARVTRWWTSAKLVSAREWLCIKEQNSIMETVYMVRNKFSVEPLRSEQAWSSRWYYENRLYRLGHHLHIKESSFQAISVRSRV